MLYWSPSNPQHIHQYTNTQQQTRDCLPLNQLQISGFLHHDFQVRPIYTKEKSCLLIANSGLNEQCMCITCRCSACDSAEVRKATWAKRRLIHWCFETKHLQLYSARTGGVSTRVTKPTCILQSWDFQFRFSVMFIATELIGSWLATCNKTLNVKRNKNSFCFSVNAPINQESYNHKKLLTPTR